MSEDSDSNDDVIKTEPNDQTRAQESQESSDTESETNYLEEGFKLEDFNYDLQYFAYYNSRFDLTKPYLVEAVTRKWGTDLPVMTLHEMADRTDEMAEQKIVVLGVIFKHSVAQRSILKEVSEDIPLLNQPVDEYASDEDSLWLQSDDETIEIVGLDIENHCTGICVALKGVEDKRRSAFLVEDFCYAQILSAPTTIDRPLPPKDQYIALVSGLGFSKYMSSNQKLVKALNILVNILRGFSSFTQKRNISRLIVAGNGIGAEARQQECDSLLDKAMPMWTQKTRNQTLYATALYDKFLSRVGRHIEVDVMPGPYDPTHQLWPQQPFNPCIFRRSFEMASVKCVTNPHFAEYSGVQMFGTCGQNIDAVRDYIQTNDAIEIMRKSLEWLHFAPTAPDTLPCYPFKDKDPFVVTSYPDLYFVGNQSEFNTGTYEAPNGKKVTLISIPNFEKKMVFVILNLRTLKSELVALN